MTHTNDRLLEIRTKVHCGKELTQIEETLYANWIKALHDTQPDRYDQNGKLYPDDEMIERMLLLEETKPSWDEFCQKTGLKFDDSPVELSMLQLSDIVGPVCNSSLQV